MKNINDQFRTAKQSAQRSMPPELERAIEEDERFFAQHTNRSFRMRLLSGAEIDFVKRAGIRLNPPMPAMRRVALVSRLLSGSRLKLTCQLPEGADMDADETACRNLFTAVLTADGVRLEEGLLAGTHGAPKHPTAINGGL